MSRDISGDSIANLLFVSYYSSDDGSSKLYLFHFYSKLRLEDLAPDGIAPLHPSPPLPSPPWFTLPIKSSSLFLSNTQHSIPAYTGIAQAVPHPRNACITRLRRGTRGEASAEAFDGLISEK